VSDREAIELRAAAWLQKRDDGTWIDAERAEFDSWLASDTNHRVAYLRLEAAWEEMNRLQALGAGYPRGRVPTPDELGASSWGTGADQSRTDAGRPGAAVRTRARWRAAAAALFAAISMGVAGYFGADHLSGDRYTTPVGGMATVPLKDGTNIILSTASRIRVQIGDRERHVDITRGEVFFDVAHDASRPFVVQAGSKRITAVGTAFSVRRDRGDVRVVVTEGKVRFDEGEGASTAPAQGPAIEPGSAAGTQLPSSADPRSAAAAAAARAPILLSAGSIAHASNAGVRIQSVALPKAEEQLSWRTGYVVFSETPLADAVAEFNRYNDRKILIKDPAIAEMRLTGKFRSTNIDTFVTLLGQSFDIHVQQSGDQIVLSEGQ